MIQLKELLSKLYGCDVQSMTKTQKIRKLQLLHDIITGYEKVGFDIFW